MNVDVLVFVIFLFAIPDSVWTQCSAPSIYTDDHDVTISYPVYSSPVTITGKRHCEWQFQKTRALVRVEVVSFDLKANWSCDSGKAPYVEVFSVQGSDDDLSRKNTRLAGRWCGKVVSATVEVQTDVTIIFKSDSPADVGKFQIKVSHQEHFRYCNSKKQHPLIVSPGTTLFIYSPGYPVMYPNVTRCQWDVQANSSGAILLLEALNTRIEDEPDCKYDNLSISGIGRVATVHCGIKHSMLLESTGPKLHINFTTDRDIEDKGFALKIYTKKPYNTSCIRFGSRALEAHPTPSLLTLSHHKDVFSCSWLIQAVKKDHVVYIETVDWDHDVLSCVTKKGLHIYDGRSNTDTRLVVSCGIERPFGFLRSTGQHLFIQADLTVNRNKIVRGFTIKYSSRHTSDFPSTYTVPSFGLSYMWIPAVTSSLQREIIHAWTFSAVDGNKCVEAVVTQRWLQEKDDTFTSYFEAYDGTKAEGIPLGYCSSVLTKPNISGTGRSLTLVQKNKSQGWYLRIKSNDECIGDLNILDITTIFQFLDFSFTTLPPGLLTCRWKLQTSSDKWIKVQPLSITEDLMSVTKGDACEQASLSSYDLDVNDVEESGDRLIKTWCPGSSRRDSVVSSTHCMMIVFRADVKYSTRFSLKIEADTSAACAQRNSLTATSNWHYISSPGYPFYNYPNNLKCVFLLEAGTRNHVVRLEIVSLELGERGQTCTGGDHLTLYDGFSTRNSTIAVLCGSGYSQTTYRSTGLKMTFSFVSNRSNTYNGFRLLYYEEEADEAKTCDHNLLATTSVQVLTFSQDIFRNSMCYWLISAPNHVYIIEVKIIEFHMYLTSSNCSTTHNGLRIYDGNSRYSNLLVTLCDYTHAWQYRSTGSYMYITFTADDSVSIKTFKMEYRALKTDLIGCVEGTEQLIAMPWPSYLSSPRYPNSYPANSQCRWRITAANRSQVVHINVIDSLLEDTHTCTRDYVELYDGYGEYAKTLGRWCGSSVSEYTSTQWYVYIVFRSNSRLSYRGFRLEYSSKPLEEPRKSGFSSHGSIGGIVGGVLGGVVGLLLLIIMCMCLISRTKTSLSRALPPDPVIVNRHNSTVFVMSPVYMGGADGMDLASPPPAYPGITNPAYLTTPDDLPPSYSSLSDYQVARLDSNEAPASFPAAEYLVPVSGLQNGSQFMRPAARVMRIPETSQNEYAQPVDPSDELDSQEPYSLDLPNAPPPPDYDPSCSGEAPTTASSAGLPPSYELSESVSSVISPSDDSGLPHPYNLDSPEAAPPPAYDMTHSGETSSASGMVPPSSASGMVPPPSASGMVPPPSASGIVPPPSASGIGPPPPYESSQGVSFLSLPPLASRDRNQTTGVEHSSRASAYENSESVRPKRNHYDALGPV